MPDTPTNDLLLHLNSLHTTEMGVERIKRNFFIDIVDVVNCIITVNSYSYTIITAHQSDK